MSKQSYQVRNWSQYNKSLVQRGSLTIWFSEESLRTWFYNGERKRGGVKIYSDMAITTALILKEVYKLPYRACEGFIKSILQLLSINEIKSPNYSTICRRAKSVTINLSNKLSRNENVCVLVDSTGIKVQGESEWYMKKHQKLTRQKWKKLHLAIDHSNQQILGVKTTNSYVHDATHFGDLIDDIDSEIDVDTIIGDGSYSLHTSHYHAQKKGAKLIAPPHRNSRKKSENKDYKYKPETPMRDEAIDYVRQYENFDIGLAAWKKENDYHRRSLVETAMFRLKTSFGDTIKAKLDCTQSVLLKIRCLILNKMASIGMPESSLSF